MDNEAVLFQGVARGDEAAFRQVFHHYNALLFPFVLKLTGSPDTAKEVLQDIFTSIWQQREKLSQVNNYRAWMYRVASNKSINYLRRQAAEGRLVQHLQTTQPATPDTPDETLQGKQIAALIEQAIQTLPPAQQQVYRLSRERHLTIPEIANIQGVSPNTAKNQLVSALKAIRTFLEQTLKALIIFFLNFFHF